MYSTKELDEKYGKPYHPRHLGEYPQKYHWIDYSEEPSESQALNLIGVINSYETRTTANGYVQEFELLQPAKVESASLKLLIFSNSEEDMPLPETKGQIIYARNILKIRQKPPTFILSAMIKENRVVILNSESKARKNMDYLHRNGVMYTDGAGYYPSERRSVIGKRIMFGGREHLTILHIEMDLGHQLSLNQIFALANKTRGERKNQSFEIHIMNFLEIILKLLEMVIIRTVENATNGNLFEVGEKPEETCNFCAEKCDCATFTDDLEAPPPPQNVYQQTTPKMSQPILCTPPPPVFSFEQPKRPSLGTRRFFRGQKLNLSPRNLAKEFDQHEDNTFFETDL